MEHRLIRRNWLYALICIAGALNTPASASAELDGICDASSIKSLSQAGSEVAKAQELKTAQKLGKLEGALQYNPYLRPADISAALEGENQSLAVLTGYVNSAEAKALAEQIALSIKGVDKVSNNLKIDKERFEKFSKQGQGSEPHMPERRLSNVTITNKVKSQLLANRQTSGINVDIVTDNRVVTIAGEVETSLERELAYWVVKNTQGVVKVVDRLDITTPLVRQASIQTVETVTEQVQ